MNYAIETRGLTRAYGSTHALDGVTLNIHENTITGLLGRNGAGKTTFMALATAQDRPGAGEVRVLGEAPFENSKVLEQLCFIRDNQRYPDDYKLKHALRAARIFYPNWSEELANELVGLFRIPTKTIVKKYSRGQMSALGIVLGLASRAKVTFFDEPYLGLDATARGYFYDVLMRDFQEHPRTIVLSTHLIDEMDMLLERVVILDQGRVVQDADVDELRAAAYEVSGTTREVEAWIDGVSEGAAPGRKVLKMRRVGGLATAIIEGSGADRRAAVAAGLDCSGVSLQALVAAYGAFDGEGPSHIGSLHGSGLGSESDADLGTGKGSGPGSVSSSQKGDAA